MKSGKQMLVLANNLAKKLKMVGQALTSNMTLKRWNIYCNYYVVSNIQNYFFYFHPLLTNL